jgi:polar amino acid transport system ATP-binding protein
VDGLVLDGSARHLGDLHRKVGMVFQFHCLWVHLTAVENICLAPVHVYGTPPGDATTRARALMTELGVGHREQALPRELSGGEAQRVAIARALAADPRLLLITCHDDDFVRDFATRVVVLADGRVVEAGDPAVVLTAPAHEATRRLLDLKDPSA